MQRTFNPPFNRRSQSWTTSRAPRSAKPQQMSRSRSHQDGSRRTDTDFVRNLTVEFDKLPSFGMRPASCSTGGVACIHQREVCTGKFSAEDILLFANRRLRQPTVRATFAVHCKSTVGETANAHLTFRCHCCRHQAGLLNEFGGSATGRRRTPKVREGIPHANQLTLLGQRAPREPT
jgi:hypothetical protein